MNRPSENHLRAILEKRESLRDAAPDMRLWLDMFHPQPGDPVRVWVLAMIDFVESDCRTLLYSVITGGRALDLNGELTERN